MMVASAAAQPGAVVFDAKLTIEIVERVFEEISRNGFKKIIISPSAKGLGTMDFQSANYASNLRLSALKDSNRTSAHPPLPEII